MLHISCSLHDTALNVSVTSVTFQRVPPVVDSYIILPSVVATHLFPSHDKSFTMFSTPVTPFVVHHQGGLVIYLF